VKDVVGPKGCVTIEAKEAAGEGASADVDAHTKTNTLRRHFAELDANNQFVKKDAWVETGDEPDHDELCQREQLFLLNAIQNDVDLTDHMDDAINSMKIVEAADKSFRTGEIVHLD
jgi:predicted dehydrogenase